MTGFAWSLVGAASRLLEREEREVVLGDLFEAHATAWNGLLDVMGLIVRRQAELWKSWRPWLAGFGLALPASFLLMGISLSVTKAISALRVDAAELRVFRSEGAARESFDGRA